MARSERFKILAIPLLVSLLAGCASSGGGGDPASGASQAQGSGSAWQLTSMLTGSYQGEGDASGLRLNVGTAGEQLTGQRFNLFVRGTGRFGDRTINELAVVRLENEASDVLVTVIPRFDSSLSELSPRATDFSQAELDAACSFYLRPDGDGFVGDTEGSGACVRAVGGAVGQWRVEIRPGTVRLSQGRSGRDLVFRKAGR